MSYKTQVALGKNSTLQRQLDDKFIEFKRNLKSSRRRLDKVEEECLSTLYKLILDVKEKREDEKQTNDRKVTDKRRAKSANPNVGRPRSCVTGSPPGGEKQEPVKRPMTSMSVRNYRQSYSFQKDGLNIDKSRRDRYIKSKKELEEKQIQIRRGNIRWSNKETLDERPKTAFDFKSETNNMDEGVETDTKPARPFTADPYLSRNNNNNNNSKLLHRPRLKNTLGTLLAPTQITEIQPSEQLPRTQAYNTDSVNGDRTQQVVTTTDSVVLQSAEDRVVNDPSHRGATPQITFRVTITKLNDIQNEDPIAPGFPITQGEQPRNNKSAAEDELLPIDENDKRHLETIMDDTSDDEEDCPDVPKPRVPKSLRATTNLEKHTGQSKVPPVEGEDNIAEMEAKTQTFLKGYAKKSKLLGYVVKTRSSSAAPRDKNKKTYRSPNVTYQELVSIKANIKQQESRTRLLLQRSAKISKYVETLANAGNMRTYLKTLKH